MNTSPVKSLFSQDFLRELEGLALLSRQLVRRSQMAHRVSRERGISPEFAEYRAYLPGDDVRHIDWQVYARTRNWVVKRFIEEHDLPMYLLVDGTESMRWGTPLKFDFARQVAAGIAYIALANNDRVGLSLLSPQTQPQLVPNRGKDRFWTILRLLSGWTTVPGVIALDGLVQQWLAMGRPQGMVLWVSDCYGSSLDDAFAALDRLRYSRHELCIIQVCDPSEADTGAPGEYQLQAIEGGEPRTVLINKTMQRQYREAYQAYQLKLRKYCKQYGLPLLQTSTATNVRDVLLKSLREDQFIA